MVTPEEPGDIGDILDMAADNSNKLSAWEENFIEDIRPRWKRFGILIAVSERQCDVLNRIANKLDRN